MMNQSENRNTIRIVCVAILFMFSTCAFATDYYVSNSGNDANDGYTPATAWLTIAHVNTIQFLPGDNLYFEGGQTFTGNIYLDNTDANDPANLFHITSFGAGRAIINAGNSNGFYALNTGGISLSNLIFDGVSTTNNTGVGVMFLSDLAGDIKFKNISVTNVEVKNFGGEGVKIYTTKGITGYENVTLDNLLVHDAMKNGIIVFGVISKTLTGYAHSNVSIKNSEVYNVPGSIINVSLEGSGIVIASTDGGLIENCVAHDNGQNNKFCGGPAGIWSLESNNITIQSCESYHNHYGSGQGCDGVGFDLDGGVTNSVMQYNYSHDNDGAGYLLGQFDNARDWSNNTMRFNISVNDGITNEGGIGIFKGPNTNMKDAFIYNNTIYVSSQLKNPGVNAAYVQDWRKPITNVNFYNNIFITEGGVSFVNIPTGFTAVFAGNLYWSLDGAFSVFDQGINYTTLLSWQMARSREMLNGNRTGYNSDPLLSNMGFHASVLPSGNLTSLPAYQITNGTSQASGNALDLSALFSIDIGTRDFWGNIITGSTNNSIGGNQFAATLPVVLIGFHGGCSGTSQKIYWATGVESDMKSFEIMYSGDGRDFKSIREVKPSGSNSLYSYINDSVANGNNYYQLKMTDLDGTVKYSKIVQVSCVAAREKINVWPNPFSQYLNVSIESEMPERITLTLQDITGKKIAEKTVFLQKGNNQVNMDDLNKYAAGSYYLRVTHPDRVEYLKLIKTGN